MKRCTIFFFDVDGTLYDSTNQLVHPSTKSAMKALHEQSDTIIAVATGRAFYMLDIIEPLKPYIDIYITINGRIIYSKNAIIHNNPMSEDAIALFKSAFMKAGLNFGYIGKHTHAIYSLDDYARAMFDKASLPCPFEAPLFDLNHDVYQMWAFGHHEAHKDINALHESYESVPWVKDGFDILHKDVHKGSGVKMVLNHLSLSKDDAYAFGDADNDITMFKAIPKSIAMGNATHTLKPHAWFMTQSVGEKGISHALKSLNYIK
jgi:Cof subfamily protein (haloacid dehalogenase superfamily)